MKTKAKAFPEVKALPLSYAIVPHRPDRVDTTYSVLRGGNPWDIPKEFPYDHRNAGQIKGALLAYLSCAIAESRVSTRVKEYDPAYGIVTLESNPPERRYLITDPFQRTWRTVIELGPKDPTPPVGVYNRRQYETACATVGLPAEEDHLLDLPLDMLHTLIDARSIFSARLRLRRAAGIARERRRLGQAILSALRDHSFASKRWREPGMEMTRTQYEAACHFIGSIPLPDEDVRTLSTDIVGMTGPERTHEWEPHPQGIEHLLARNRALGLKKEPDGGCRMCSRPIEDADDSPFCGPLHQTMCIASRTICRTH